MESVYRKGYVFVQERYAGIISETEDGYRFCYDTKYVKSENALPVSLTLPLSQREYSSNVLFSFFDGLIPEGWLLSVAVKNWKLDLNDRFGLLLSVCYDCIGDVSVRNEVDA